MPKPKLSFASGQSTNRRFTLDEERHVIDAVNPANSGRGYCHYGAPEDDRYLRERVFMIRLGEMLEKLMTNVRSMQEHWGAFNENRHAIWKTILAAVSASHLNSFDPTMSIQHKFNGKLIRRKERYRDFTSLSLFGDDIERLLRDLYGDLENEAMDSVVLAVFRIVQEFTRYVRPDIWKEHADAEELDYMLGIGVPEGYGVNGSEWRRGMAAKVDLFRRVREVNANPSSFSEYTIEFAKRFAEEWDVSGDPDITSG